MKIKYKKRNTKIKKKNYQKKNWMNNLYMNLIKDLKAVIIFAKKKLNILIYNKKKLIKSGNSIFIK